MRLMHPNVRTGKKVVTTRALSPERKVYGDVDMSFGDMLIIGGLIEEMYTYSTQSFFFYVVSVLVPSPTRMMCGSEVTYENRITMLCLHLK